MFYSQSKGGNLKYCSRQCHFKDLKENPQDIVKHVFLHNCLLCDKQYSSLNGRKGYCCKKCQNKSESNHRKTKYEARSQELLALKGGQCEICAYNACKRALSYHHVDPTTKNFQLSSNNLYRSWDEIIEESKKCRLLCQNCHANLHEEERNKTVSKRDSIRKEKYTICKKEFINKMGGKCNRCNYDSIYIQSFTFHHKNKLEKLFPLDCIAFATRDEKELQAEVNKCELLCFNCHMEIEDSIK